MSAAEQSSGRGALAILGMAQFVMVIDSTVMNVSLTKVVEDLGTTVVGMQAAITMFTLVMAAFMLTGGKLGVAWGARRAFAIGLVVYDIGSLITALSPNLTVLLVGWSLVEGLGAVLVMPAIIALVGLTFTGTRRATAFGLIGGIAGAAAAAGPLIGGWVSQVYTWRYVFAAETVVCLLILLSIRLLPNTKRAVGQRLDVIGVALSAGGLAAAVFGVLRSSTWGVITPKAAAPFAILNLSPALWCIALGAGLLTGFFWWEARVARTSGDPLMDVALMETQRERGGMGTLACLQFLIAGVFFVLPLYLQTMLGLDPLATGVRMVPLSAALFVAALLGARLASRLSPRLVCEIGLVTAFVGLVGLAAALDPELRGVAFGVALAIFGAGAGLVMSQIGSINLSGVSPEQGAEVGGLQGTAQNLGFSLGTAVVGAMVLASLAGGFVRFAQQQPELAADLQPQLQRAADSEIDFVSASQVEEAASAKTSPAETAAIVASYQRAQLVSLKLAAALMAVVAVGGLWFARKVPVVLAGEAAAAAPAAVLPA